MINAFTIPTKSLIDPKAEQVAAAKRRGGAAASAKREKGEPGLTAKAPPQASRKAARAAKKGRA